MALVNNVNELRRLLSQLDLPVTSTEQLRDLLLTVQFAQSEEPALRQLLLDQREREHAVRDRAAAAEHQERMRALELGHPLPDPKTAQAQAAVLRTIATAAAILGSLVTVATVGAAVGTTAFLVYQVPQAIVPCLCVLWPVCGILSAVTVSISLSVLLRLRFDLQKLQRPAAPRQPDETPLSVLPVEKPPTTLGQFRER